VRVLGFDTATRATTVALCDLEGGDLRLERRDDPPHDERPRHATRLMPLIVGVLERAATSWSEVDRIAVGIGPGTFTGLRIGIATARALSRALEIPLVGVSTLESLALNGLSGVDEPRGVDPILAVLDARRGEVFAAGWRVWSAEGTDALPQHRSVLSQRALSPDSLARLVPDFGSSVLAIGDGAIEFRAVLERSGAMIPADDSDLHRVTAVNHCLLAGSLRGSAPDEIRPEYLRLPDAEIARRAAHH
jgi:tRNA threonylcarbamoyladenosine biosynthesis protein TsaB